jgi:hypothetical protein
VAEIADMPRRDEAVAREDITEENADARRAAQREIII